MRKFIGEWEALCASSPILRFIDINLRDVRQVMFQDNPLTGLPLLAAIALGRLQRARWRSSSSERIPAPGTGQPAPRRCLFAL